MEGGKFYLTHSVDIKNHIHVGRYPHCVFLFFKKHTHGGGGILFKTLCRYKKITYMLKDIHTVLFLKRLKNTIYVLFNF